MQVKALGLVLPPGVTEEATIGATERTLVAGGVEMMSAIGTAGALVTKSALIQTPVASSNQSPAAVRALMSRGVPAAALPTIG
jgi:hypothetical protein